MTTVRPALLGWVVLGGAVGTAVRDLIEGAWPAAGGWPWATLIINVSGAFALGVLLEWLAASGPDEGGRRTARFALGTGLLGGYTTYSTFVVDSVALAGDGRVGLALAYDAASLAAGFVAALVGMMLPRLAGRGAP